jgi:hypothetical protein
MKLITKPANKLIICLMAFCSFFGLIAQVNSQTVQVTVNPNLAWQGYMNVFALPVNGGGFQFGQAWANAALQADFLGTTQLDLFPCTNVWETTDTYWVQADGVTPNENMDASMYIQNDALINTNIAFTGTCLSNTLTANPEPHTGIYYTCTAFIKAFNGSYTVIASVSSNMVAGQPFSITLNTAGAAHVQYGFETIGPDANPGTAPSLGNVVIAASGPTIPSPTNNAPVPANTAPIVAMYDSSGVYPEVPVDDWLASWSSANEASYTIPDTGNVVLKYSALSYAGVEFYDPIGIDTAGCNEMHVNIWTPNANQFGIQLVSLDNNGTQAAQVNFTPASGTIVSNQWISLNIPLSQFLSANPTLDLTNLQQLLWIDNQGGGAVNGIFYIDNVYFYSNSALAPSPPPLPQPTNAAATPTASSALAMYDSSGIYSETPVIDWDASWSSAGEALFTITNTGNTVLEYVSLQYAGVEFYNAAADEINVDSYNTMHVDIWTPIANQFGIQLVSLDSGVGTGTQAGQVNFTPASGTIVSNQWVGLNIPLSQFTTANSTLDLTDLQQLLWIDNQGGGYTGGIFYIDNVYFYNSSVAQPPQMTANITSGTVNISFPTENGFNYTVWYTPSLTNPSWQVLSNGSVTGNNYTQMVTDTPGQTTRFYRVSVSVPMD